MNVLFVSHHMEVCYKRHVDGFAEGEEAKAQTRTSIYSYIHFQSHVYLLYNYVGRYSKAKVHWAYCTCTHLEVQLRLQ